MTGPATPDEVASMVVGTAYWIAAARARESLRPDRLFDDPYAAVLAGTRGPAMMAASERVGGGENQFLPVRTRYFDDAVRAAVADGIDQVVLLGAGMDSRAYRLDMPPDLDWYEVDRPELFAVKDPALASAVPRCRRRPVVADVTADLLTPLADAGWRADRRTAWVAEGLLFYLWPAQVRALLRSLAAAGAPGSRLLADVMGDTALRRPTMDEYRRRRGVRGLPPPYGHDDPAALLAAHGWEIHTLTWAGAPDANFGRFPARPAAPACAAEPPGPTPRSDRPATPTRAHLVVGRT